METDIGHSAHRKINEYSRIIAEIIKNDAGKYTLYRRQETELSCALSFRTEVEKTLHSVNT